MSSQLPMYNEALLVQVLIHGVDIAINTQLTHYKECTCTQRACATVTTEMCGKIQARQTALM